MHYVGRQDITHVVASRLDVLSTQNPTTADATVAASDDVVKLSSSHRTGGQYHCAAFSATVAAR